MKFTPIDDNVLLWVKKSPDVSVNGIFMPDISDSQRNRWYGIVEAIGDKVPHKVLKPGDMVKYNPHGAQMADVSESNRKLIVVPYSDIYCVFEEETVE